MRAASLLGSNAVDGPEMARAPNMSKIPVGGSPSGLRKGGRAPMGDPSDEQPGPRELP